jgi:hypothetical protein
MIAFMIYLRIRINTLLAFSLMASRPTLVKAAEEPRGLFLRYTFPPTTPAPTISMLDLARTMTWIIPLETIILLLLCIFLIIFSLRWIHRYYRSRFQVHSPVCVYRLVTMSQL